jgi:hypothetical protein
VHDAWARRVLLMQSGAFFFIFLGAGAQQLYLSGYLQVCTDWTPVRRGAVIATVYASMMVFRVANVYLLRGWSDWLLSLVGSLTYTLFTLVMLATFWLKSYPLALAGAVVWGWGASAMWAGTTLQFLAATDAGQRKHGAIQGLLYAVTDAGWLAGTILLGMIHARASLPPYALYAVAAGMTVVGNVLAVLAPRDLEPQGPMPTVGDLLRVASRGKALVAGFLLVASSLSFGLMLGAFRDYLEHTHGPQALWVTAMFYPGMRLMLRFAGGRMSDCMGHATVLATSFLSAAAGMFVAAGWQTIAGAALAAGTLGLLNGAVPVVASAMVGESADRARRPLAYGTLFAWRDLGVVVATLWGQALMGGGGDFAFTFRTFAVVFVVCGVLSLLLQKYAEERL